MHYYSAIKNSFYLDSLKAAYEANNKWPPDAIKVTSEEWETYGKARAPAGMQRGPDENGRPAWVPIPPEALDDLTTRKLTELEQALSTALAAGMPYTMPDGTEEIVQTRPEDEPNLLGLAIEARDLRDAGETSTVQQLRMLSNKVYELTPEQMIEVTDAAKQFKKQQLARSWHLKDQVRQVLAEEDLDEDAKRSAIAAVTW